jgi:hypothetical protein
MRHFLIPTTKKGDIRVAGYQKQTAKTYKQVNSLNLKTVVPQRLC